MKNLCLFLTILILCSCSVNQKDTQLPASPAGDALLAISKTAIETEPLILDGRPYVEEGKVYRKDEAHLITSIYCDFAPDANERWHSLEGMEQLENLRSLSLNGEGEILDRVDFTPLASLSNLLYLHISGGAVRMYSFKGIEQLANLKRLTIYGDGGFLADVDFTPLASLSSLEEIRFNDKITHLPDLTMLANLHTILIGSRYTDAALESLEGIGAPNARRIEITNSERIDSLAPLNNLVYLEDLKIGSLGKGIHIIADIANLPGLKRLEISGRVDLKGIENMSALEELTGGYSEIINIEGIGKLANLKKLSLNITSPNPSLEFLRNMPNLTDLHLYADGGRRDYPLESEAYQILDLSPLATVKSLQHLSCINFIIKNISALDELYSLPINIDMYRSRLFDETEKTRYEPRFEDLTG